MNSQQLRVIPDIEFIVQESLTRRDTNIILGSRSENSFIKMSGSTYQYAAEIVEYLKRGITEEELQHEIAAKHPGQNIDTAAFVEHLKSAGIARHHTVQNPVSGKADTVQCAFSIYIRFFCILSFIRNPVLFDCYTDFIHSFGNHVVRA